MTFPVGRTVKEVRWITEGEAKDEGWDGMGQSSLACSVVVFDDGSKVYASQDGEGNGPGCMFGVTESGEMLHIEPPPSPKKGRS